MNARFWWAARRCWHHPQMVAMRACDGFAPWMLLRSRAPGVRGWVIRHNAGALWQHAVKLAAKVWSHGPLACNGDRGPLHFTVDFCDWLENQALRSDRRD